jgi:hypothetical protein
MEFIQESGADMLLFFLLLSHGDELELAKAQKTGRKIKDKKFFCLLP